MNLHNDLYRPLYNRLLISRQVQIACFNHDYKSVWCHSLDVSNPYNIFQ